MIATPPKKRAEEKHPRVKEPKLRPRDPWKK
jgi:hypothetical protein